MLITLLKSTYSLTSHNSYLNYLSHHWSPKPIFSLNYCLPSKSYEPFSLNSLPKKSPIIWGHLWKLCLYMLYLFTIWDINVVKKFTKYRFFMGIFPNYILHNTTGWLCFYVIVDKKCGFLSPTTTEK